MSFYIDADKEAAQAELHLWQSKLEKQEKYANDSLEVLRPPLSLEKMLKIRHRVVAREKN